MKMKHLCRTLSLALCLSVGAQTVGIYTVKAAGEDATKVEKSGTHSKKTSEGGKIEASDFGIYLEAGDLTKDNAKVMSALKVYDANGNAYNKKMSTVNMEQLNAINEATQDAVYQLTFYAPDGTDITVSVDVEPKKNYYPCIKVENNDLTYDLGDGEMTLEKAIELSGAVAYDKDGKPLPSSSITCNERLLKSVNNSDELGDHILCFFINDYDSYSGKELSVLTKNSKDNRIFMDGDDFSYTYTDSTPLKADEAKKLAKLVAKDAMGNTVDLSKISVSEDDLKKINSGAQQGTYNLTFTSPEGDELKVKVSVNTPSVWHIEAGDFAYTKKGSDELKSDGALFLAKAKLIDQFGNEPKSNHLMANASQLKAINDSQKDGVFDLKISAYDREYSSASDVTVKVNLTVTRSWTFKASPFTYTKNSADDKLSVDEIISQAKVTLVNDLGDKDTEILCDEAGLNELNNATEDGVFFVTLYNKDKSAYTQIPVTLKINYKIDDPDKDDPGKDDPGKDDPDNPGKDDPGKDDPDDPGKDDPGKDDPDDPGKDDPGKDDPDDPGKDDPDDPGKDDPGKDDPGKDDPGKDDPDDPGKDDPGKDDPDDPGKDDPGKDDPGKDDPDDPSKDDPDEKHSKLYAYDFTYDLSNGVLAASRAKAYASVKAYDSKGARISLTKIAVNSSELAALNKASAGETVDLTFTTQDGVSKTVKVTLKDSTEARAQLITLLKLLLNAIYNGKIDINSILK